jgi:hypothetical protein
MNHSLFRRLRRGSALVVTMMVLLLLSVLGTSLTGMALTDARLTQRRTDELKALNLSIAGLDLAQQQMYLIADYGGFTDLPLGEGKVTVRVTAAMPAGYRHLTSTATLQTAGGGTIVKQVRGTAGLSVFAPLFGKAIAAKTLLDVNDDIRVDSSPLPGMGDIHSNGDLYLRTSGSRIEGAVTACGTLQNDGATVTGNQESEAAPIVFPDFDSTFKNLSLVGGTVPPVSILNLGYSSNNKSFPTITVNGLTAILKGKVNGNLVVGPQGCTMVGVVWVTGTLTVNGPIRGVGTVVADGDVTLDPQTDYLNILPELVGIGTTSKNPVQAVRIQGNRTIKAVVYAPNGAVQFAGSPHLIGGVMADRVTVNSGARPYITAFTSPSTIGLPLPSILDLQVWEEGPFQDE